MAIAERRMPPSLVVVNPPSLDQDLRYTTSIEDFPIRWFIAEHGSEKATLFTFSGGLDRRPGRGISNINHLFQQLGYKWNESLKVKYLESSMETTSGRKREMPLPPDTVESPKTSGENAKEALRNVLEVGTGWQWDASELAHFCTRPKAFRADIMKWRRELVSSACQGTFELLSPHVGRPQAEIRAEIDDALAVLREIARILLVSRSDPRTGTTPSTEDHKGAILRTSEIRNGPDRRPELNPGAARVITRLNPFRSLRIVANDIPPSGQAPAVWDLVPPSMRPPLQVQLERHAAEVCHLEKPNCGSCELARFCRDYRERAVNTAEARDEPIFVDLFCGAGGISVGFGHIGFRPVLAIDADDAACTTYRTNHSDIREEDVLCADIREVSIEDMWARLRGRPLDVLIGAPPCQGFSLAGMRSKQALAARTSLAGYSITEDERNYFFQFVVGAAAGLKPKLVLMENVPGMDSPRPGGAPSFMRMAEEMLREAGFLTAVWKLDAAGYGVPQRRVRTFLVGSSIGRLPAVPEAEFQHSAARSIDPDALPPITVEAALFDLPAVEADGGEVVMRSVKSVAEDDRRYRYYLRNRRFPVTKPSRLIFNHKCRYHNPQDLELYSLLRPGEDSIHVIERHGRGDLMRYRRDVFDDKYARLRPDKPSKTIVSHLAKDGNSYVHPAQTRSITPREGARLQSFPDDFVFCGAPSEQWTQIGNSVPPALAAAIARSFRELLEQEKSR
jgi:DNA (cytosine-5)-methyltransferase 1